MKTIKHFIASALCVGCLATGASAQSNFGEFRWGLKGGVNFAHAYHLPPGIETDKGKVGFVGGGFCKIPIKHFLSVRPELLFSMKGSTLEIPSDVTGVVDKFRYSVNYVEVPLSLDFDLPFFLDFHAGVQTALLITKELKVNGANVGDGPGEFDDTEFGWHVGGGIDLGNIGVHVRFQQSLSSYYESPLFGGGKLEPRNWNLSLTASYMFMFAN